MNALDTLNRSGMSMLAAMVEQPEPRTFAAIMFDIAATEKAISNLYAVSCKRELTDSEDSHYAYLEAQLPPLRNEARARFFVLTGVTFDQAERVL